MIVYSKNVKIEIFSNQVTYFTNIRYVRLTSVHWIGKIKLFVDRYAKFVK